MLVVVLPSPAFVGVIAVTMTSLPSGLSAQPVEDRQLHLAAELAVLLELVGQDAGVLGDLGDRSQLGVVGDLERLFSSIFLTGRDGLFPTLSSAYFYSADACLRPSPTSLANATSRGRWTHPQSGLTTSARPGRLRARGGCGPRRAPATRCPGSSRR